MATRFTSQSVSELGTTYTVAIDDSSYGGSEIDIEIAGFEITYDPEKQDDPATPIIPSSCRVIYNIVRSETRTDFNSFISDLLDADEGRFRLKITDSAGGIYWLGFIITDQVAYEDDAWADPVARFEVRATDGISRLKDLDYNDAGTAYTGRVLLSEHIFNLLDKIGLLDFYGASDDVLYTRLRWYEDGMGASNSDDPLALTYVDHSVFYSIDGEGNYEYQSGYDVLKQIAQMFLSRFYYSAGYWRMDQIKEYGQSTLYTHQWLADGTKRATSTDTNTALVENSDDIVRLGNVKGMYRYFAPAREIKVKYTHFNDRNYLIGQTWSDNADPEIQWSFGGGTDIRLWIRGTIVHEALFSPVSDFEKGFFLFQFKIRASIGGTTYYLKRDYTISNGSISYGEPSWETAIGQIYYFVCDRNEYSSPLQTQTEVNFETPEMPADGDVDAYIDLEFDEYFHLNPNQTTLSPSTVTWQFYNVIGQLTADDDSALTSFTNFSKTNAATPNASLVLEYETLLGDAASDTFYTSSVVTIDNAGTEETGREWAKGIGGGGKPIIQLWLDELMTLRNKSLLRYEGQIYGTAYQFHEIWETIENKELIGQRLTYNSKTDIWSGDWWQVGTNRAIDGTLANPTNHPTLMPGLPVFPPPGPTRGGNPEPGLPFVDPVFETVSGGGTAVAQTTVPVEGGGGAITTITIDPIGNGCTIASGDTITLFNPATGDSETFTVTADVGASDTTISISSTNPTNSYISGAYVIMNTGTYANNIQGCIASSWYDEEFSVNEDTSVTVTVNSGTLPTANAQIWVYYNGQLLPPTGNWSKSGSNINFTFAAFGNVYIRFVI